jgi:hypothetical protein
MELHCKLDPESVRKLSLRLYGEEALKADPAAVISGTLDWVDQVLANSETQLSGKPVQNDFVHRLTELVNRKGVANVAAELEVSVATLRSWQHGVTPNLPNLEKIKTYLKSQTPASDVADAAAESLKPGELFYQPEFGQQQTSDEGQDNS